MKTWSTLPFRSAIPWTRHTGSIGCDVSVLLLRTKFQSEELKKFVEWIKTPNKEAHRPYTGTRWNMLLFHPHIKVVTSGVLFQISIEICCMVGFISTRKVEILLQYFVWPDRYPQFTGQTETSLRMCPPRIYCWASWGKGNYKCNWFFSFQASTGDESVLDIQPTDIHQRIPLFIGNASDVEAAEAILAGKTPQWVK